MEQSELELRGQGMLVALMNAGLGSYADNLWQEELLNSVSLRAQERASYNRMYNQEKTNYDNELRKAQLDFARAEKANRILSEKLIEIKHEKKDMEDEIARLKAEIVNLKNNKPEIPNLEIVEVVNLSTDHIWRELSGV